MKMKKRIDIPHLSSSLARWPRGRRRPRWSRPARTSACRRYDRWTARQWNVPTEAFSLEHNFHKLPSTHLFRRSIESNWTLLYGLTHGIFFHTPENVATFLNDGAASKWRLHLDNYCLLFLKIWVRRKAITWFEAWKQIREDNKCILYFFPQPGK